MLGFEEVTTSKGVGGGYFLPFFDSYVVDGVEVSRWLPGAFCTVFVPFLRVLGEMGRDSGWLGA